MSIQPSTTELATPAGYAGLTQPGLQTPMPSPGSVPPSPAMPTPTSPPGGPVPVPVQDPVLPGTTPPVQDPPEMPPPITA